MSDDQPQQPEWKLGTKLTAALDSLGWTDRQLAEKSGVAAQTVNNLKRGYASHNLEKRFRPRADNVLKVARALRAAGVEVSIVEWMRDAGHDPTAYEDAGEDAALRSRRVAEKHRRLQPSEQKLVEDLVDALLVARGYVAPADPAEPPVNSSYEFASDGVQTSWSEGQGSVDRQHVD